MVFLVHLIFRAWKMGRLEIGNQEFGRTAGPKTHGGNIKHSKVSAHDG